PADFSRPPRQTWKGSVACTQVDGIATRALEQLAVDRRATLFTVLVAAWQLLLHRYSGQDDIISGTVVAGRTRPELEDMIGFLVNTVALRTHVSDDMLFYDFISEVDSTVLDAQVHQDAPFDRVVAELNHERDPSR